MKKAILSGLLILTCSGATLATAQVAGLEGSGKSPFDVGIDVEYSCSQAMNDSGINTLAACNSCVVGKCGQSFNNHYISRKFAQMNADLVGESITVVTDYVICVAAASAACTGLKK